MVDISSFETPLETTVTVPLEALAVTFLTPEIDVSAFVIFLSHPPQSIPETLNSWVSALENSPMRQGKRPQDFNTMVDRGKASPRD